MTRREIAEVACRILALAMFGYGWVSICGVVVYRLWLGRFSQYDTLLADQSPLFVGIGWLAVSSLIWFRAPVYAARMTNDDPEPIVTTGLSVRDVLSLACCVVGLCIAAPAFIALVTLALEFALSAYGSDDTATAIRESQVQLAAQSVKLLSGLLLIFGRHGTAEAISRMRNAGLDRNAVSSDEVELAGIEKSAELPELLPVDEEKST